MLVGKCIFQQSQKTEKTKNKMQEKTKQNTTQQTQTTITPRISLPFWHSVMTWLKEVRLSTHSYKSFSKTFMIHMQSGNGCISVGSMSNVYTHAHLQYTAKGPWIDFIAVTFLAENFRCNVVRSSTQCPTTTHQIINNVIHREKCQNAK